MLVPPQSQTQFPRPDAGAQSRLFLPPGDKGQRFFCRYSQLTASSPKEQLPERGRLFEAVWGSFRGGERNFHVYAPTPCEEIRVGA